MIHLILAIILGLLSAHQFIAYGKSEGSLIFTKDSPSVSINTPYPKEWDKTHASPIISRESREDKKVRLLEEISNSLKGKNQ